MMTLKDAMQQYLTVCDMNLFIGCTNLELQQAWGSVEGGVVTYSQMLSKRRVIFISTAQLGCNYATPMYVDG